MNHSTAFYVALLVTASLVVGWYGARAWLSHGDLTGTLKRISGMRKARGSFGTIAIGAIIIWLLLLYEVLRGHK